MANIKAVLIGMLAETPLHPGTGQSTGVVDLPVARDASTGIPHIPETGLKGAMREKARAEWPPTGNKDHDTVRKLFGDAAQEGAGVFFLTTGRLALLPIRRLNGVYAWVTTPNILERLARDLEFIGEANAKLNGAAVRLRASAVSGTIVAGADWAGNAHYLEETPFEVVAHADLSITVDALTPLMANSPAAGRLAKQLVIMNDDDFGWFAENALPVAAHNVLDENKISKNLWYEETLPPDAVFWFCAMPRSVAHEPAFTVMIDRLVPAEPNYLRIGGNETVGHGWTLLSRAATRQGAA